MSLQRDAPPQGLTAAGRGLSALHSENAPSVAEKTALHQSSRRGPARAVVTAAPDRRESSERYSGELLRAGDYRVVVCAAGIQWVIQRRRSGAEGPAGPRWEGVSYCTTRAALVRLWRLHSGHDGAELEALPAVFSRFADKGGEHEPVFIEEG